MLGKKSSQKAVSFQGMYIYFVISSFFPFQTLYTGIVIYAPALALNQGKMSILQLSYCYIFFCIEYWYAFFWLCTPKNIAQGLAMKSSKISVDPDGNSDRRPLICNPSPLIPTCKELQRRLEGKPCSQLLYLSCNILR